MRLYVNDRSLNVAQMGPRFLILRELIDLPPGPADVSLSIDGKVDRWSVWLPDGISANQSTVRIDPPRVPAE